MLVFVCWCLCVGVCVLVFECWCLSVGVGVLVFECWCSSEFLVMRDKKVEPS